MLRSLDIGPGENYRLYEGVGSFVGTFIKLKPDGTLVFKRNDAQGRWYVKRNNFLAMRGNGSAVRLNGNQQVELPAIEPDAFEPIAESDSKRVKSRKRKYLRAVTQKWYVTLIDELGISRSIKPIEALLKEYEEKHAELGLSKAPGASTLIELCRTHGVPGFRPIQIFVSNAGGDQKSNLWDQFILDRKAEMIRMYYEKRTPPMTDVAAFWWFKGEVAAEQDRREACKTGLLKEPGDSTIKDWIEMGGSLEAIAQREGRTTANRQRGGIVPHQGALRPLECVVMDHTQIDLHLVLLDENGEIKDSTRRPWLMLVVDVYTRMILAANLTWEHPSLYTLIEGLRQTVKPKDFLGHLATSSSLKFACDGYGKFARMIVDNGLENVGQSMRVMAYSAGLTVTFAAIRNPETKSIVERTFGTINTQLWHQAHGGIRHRPGVLKGENPSEEARFTLEEAQEMLWEYIVTVYHVGVHSGINMAPARKWKEAYQYFNRPLIDDMRLIEQVFNKTEERQLTRAGIRIGNQTYHHPDRVSELIDDLSVGKKNKVAGPKGKKLTGSNKNSSVSISVRVSPGPDGGLRSRVVYNHTRKTYVELPNINPEMRGSVAQEKVRRIENNRANEEFYPARQVDLNRSKLSRKVAPHDLHSSSDAPPAEKRGSSHRIAIHNADGPMISRKGTQRGVAARRRKAAEANKLSKLRAKKEATRNREDAAGTQMFDPSDLAANIAVTEPKQRFESSAKEALIARMRAKLKLKNVDEPKEDDLP